MSVTIEEMKAVKRSRGYSYEQVAELSGVPLSTVLKIFSGETRSPRYGTMQALDRFFTGSTGQGAVQERAMSFAHKQPGEYTAEDYCARIRAGRAELIDGVMYDMGEFLLKHQVMAGEIYCQFLHFIRRSRIDGIPFLFPVDVCPDCDERTTVRPDVTVVCDRAKIRENGIYGAPDFIAEILSPDSRQRDCIQKLDKYRSSGVKEYWIVDPDKEKVIAYQFEEELYPLVYGFDMPVPVGIFQGECRIDIRQSLW